MQCIIYVRQSGNISLYTQFNNCSKYSKRYGYSIKSKVLDFEGDRFYEAVNKIIADDEISTFIIYSKDIAFDSNDDYLFYRIYLEKLGKKLINCE